ncbi:MAG TPA: L,D-transpeptidase [Caulobacteraceae bacterium]
MNVRTASLLPVFALAALAACGQDQENASDRSGATAAAPQAQARTNAAFSREAVDAASFSAEAAASQDRTPAVLRAQVLLDRARFSPGIIDGKPGENVRQAVAAFEKAYELPVDGQLDAAVFQKLTQLDNRPALADYEITAADVKGPFIQSVPQELEDKGKLPAMSYTSALEGLAEKFHATEELLQTLNPGADFSKAGTRIVVPDVANQQLPSAVASIEVNRAEREVRVYDAEKKLLAFYPATIGSDVLPTPSGSLKVSGVAPEPDYTFDPAKLNWDGAKTKVTVKPGPNNPVGSVWIDLNKPTYGIHGTDEPRTIGKAVSHGCVRLTNWDAEELASQVKPGVPVRFL